MMTGDTLDKLKAISLASIAPVCTDAQGDAAILLPVGYQVEDVSGFFPPKRITQSPKLVDAGSFSDYVNRFKTEATQLFATVTEDGVVVVALLDYHSGAPQLAPAYCAHTCTFTAKKTPEWKTWMDANRKRMGQVEFATWLEDNAKLMVAPSGADLLELVKTLAGSNQVRFDSAIRLDNGGAKVSFSEEVTLRGTITEQKGEVDLPAVIKAGIAIYEGSPAYEISARLKYKIVSNKLELWFETIQLPDILRENIKGVVQVIADKTKIIPYLGTAN